MILTQLRAVIRQLRRLPSHTANAIYQGLACFVSTVHVSRIQCRQLVLDVYFTRHIQYLLDATCAYSENSVMTQIPLQAGQQHAERGRRPPQRSRPSLLIVDSLSSLVSPVMGPGGSEDGHSLMICLGRALKGLAQRHSLAVITTNHIVGGVHPAMLIFCLLHVRLPMHFAIPRAIVVVLVSQYTDMGNAYALAALLAEHVGLGPCAVLACRIRQCLLLICRLRRCQASAWGELEGAGQHAPHAVMHGALAAQSPLGCKHPGPLWRFGIFRAWRGGPQGC